ncbi:MAG: 2-oxoglutarate oxidoreductase, partial [Anaerolineales bacterium]|nr:2-oxoglutarate oxidoreductase [Anaerolineales bacterium]
MISEKIVYQRPITLSTARTHYCPGCTHGTAHRLVAETIDELGIRERTILVASVGCSVFAYDYFDVDACEAPHGRAPAMATGIKRVSPANIVFTYQGDGDLASIGLGEAMHAAARGENITIIFINNAVYGMTGGQMAPTSLIGQKTTSSPLGRDPKLSGTPLHIAELMAGLPGVAYSVRRSLHDARHVIQAKKAIRLAFEAQMQHL